jgi:hypothetical protein
VDRLLDLDLKRRWGRRLRVCDGPEVAIPRQGGFRIVEVAEPGLGHGGVGLDLGGHFTVGLVVLVPLRFDVAQGLDRLGEQAVAIPRFGKGS